MQFDYEKILALDGMRQTDVLRATSSAHLPDAVMELRYDGLAYGALSGAAEWLYANRAVLVDAEPGGQSMPGAWRTVSVIAEPKRERDGTITGAVLVQRFAKGYYEKWDWAAVRVKTRTIGIGKNTDLPTGLEAYVGGLYTEVAELRMPYVNQAKASSVVDSMKAASFADAEIGKGEKFAGTWFNLGVRRELKEDNTADVVLVIGKPKYATYSFSGSGTFETTDSWLLAGVPVAEIDGVLAAWRAGRIGATARVGAINDNLVSIELSLPVPKSVIGQGEAMTEDRFSRTEQARSINQETAEPFPADQATGRIVRIDNEKTTLGKYNVSVSEEDAKLAEWRWDWPTPYGTAYGFEGRNSATEEPGDDGESGVPSFASLMADPRYRIQARPSLNRFNLWDYQYVFVPQADGFEDPVSVVTTEVTRQWRQAHYHEGRNQWRIVVWLNHVKHFKNHGQLFSWMDDTDKETPHHNPHWHQTGLAGGWLVGSYDTIAEVNGIGWADTPDGVPVP